MADLNEKALEAAFKAAAPGLRNNRWDEGIEAAITAYLSHILQGAEERVARAITDKVYIVDMIGGYTVENPHEVARAALSALLTPEQKP